MPSASSSPRELVESYLDWMQDTKRRSPGTVYSYGRIYTALLGYLSDRYLLALTTERPEDFIFSRRRTKTRGPRPSATKVNVGATAIRSLFKRLDARGLIHRDPTLRPLASLPAVHNEDPRSAPEAVRRQVWYSDLRGRRPGGVGLRPPVRAPQARDRATPSRTLP